MIDPDDEEMGRYIRAGFGPVPDMPPARDLWPDVIARIRRRPAFSRVDRVLIALLIGGLFVFTPRQVVLLLWCL